MPERIKLTKKAFEELESLKKNLEKTLAGIKDKKGDILTMQNTERDIREVSEILDNAQVIEFSEKVAAQVIIGVKVMIENLRSGDTREYWIMTRTTANPLKGVISNESPLAQKIMGLKLGNTFKFRDVTNQEETYKIKSID
jgi:transcription elongation factor GreA